MGGIERRRLLQATGLTLGGLVMPWSWGQQQQTGSTALKIPPLLAGDRREGEQRYSLRIQTGQSRFLSGLDTPTLGINGDYLGPTLRLRDGDDAVIDVDNGLSEPTTLHWHGLHVPAHADGGPHQVVQPGGSWQARFRVQQQAGTYWYHSHQIHRTGEQVYRGLAGLIVVDDDASERLALPSDYGVDDIPLIVQDRRFNEDGSFRYVSSHRDIMAGLMGDTILVNGTLDPYFEPTTEKVRFRLHNAANARTFTFAFSDGRDFQQLSCDGGFLAQPLPRTEMELAPGERCEIVVDFSDRSPVSLLSLPMAANSPNQSRGMMRRMLAANEERFHVLAIRPQSNLGRSEPLPPILTEVGSFESAGIDRLRRFELGMVMGMGRMMGRRGGGQSTAGNFFINGNAMAMDRIDERVPVGSTEIWEIHNDTMMMHPFHIHHGQFQVYRRNGQPPTPHERAYKDTVKVGPGETVQVLMEFQHFADPELPYMYHCHILEHEDDGMMGQFVVE